MPLATFGLRETGAEERIKERAVWEDDRRGREGKVESSKGVEERVERTLLIRAGMEEVEPDFFKALAAALAAALASFSARFFRILVI